MQKETVQSKIVDARSSPQSSKHLQPIYEAHQEVVFKEVEIAEVKHELAAAREAQSPDKFELPSSGTQPQVNDKVLID